MMKIIEYNYLGISFFFKIVMFLILLSINLSCFIIRDASKEFGGLYIKNIAGESITATITIGEYVSRPIILANDEINELAFFSNYKSEDRNYDFPTEAKKLLLVRQNNKRVVFNRKQLKKFFTRIKGQKYSWIITVTPELLILFNDIN